MGIDAPQNATRRLTPEMEKEMDRLRFLTETLKAMRDRLEDDLGNKQSILSNIQWVKNKNGRGAMYDIKIRYNQKYDDKVSSFLDREAKLIDGLLATQGGGKVEIRKDFEKQAFLGKRPSTAVEREVAEEMYSDPLMEATITITD